MNPLSISERIRGATRFSRFATRLLQSWPDCQDELEFAEFRGWDRDGMDRFLGGRNPRDSDSLNRGLRELRRRVFVRLALRDLAGLAPLSEAHATMSALAEASIAAAHRFWTRSLEADLGIPRAGGARQELLVVAMGKLGGAELNVSSDIDLIFLFREDGETDGPRPLSNLEFFTRLGQRIIAALEERTADGHVFRVDMRLRPWGDGGPLVASFAALEHYFLVHGREWERYAWIKARVVAGAGSALAGDDARVELADEVRSFVYRRYLDYDAIGALRALHAQIQAEVARRDLADDVKLGAGGIREIEFITQAHQLIRGGRDPQLQVQATMPALELLAVKGLIRRDAVRELLSAYTFLRRLEHRLQYLDDAQTHALPRSAEDLQLIAAAMDFHSTARFQQAFEFHRERVTHHFASVFAAPLHVDAGRDVNGMSELDGIWQQLVDKEEARDRLSRLGYQDPEECLRRLQALRTSSRYRSVPASSQARIDRLVPAVIQVSAEQAAPDATLARMLTLIETVAGRSAYLAFLSERHMALERIAAVMAASSWAAGYLTRHPILLDEILALEAEQAPDPHAFATQLRQAIAEFVRDPERAMDVMREFHHAAVFRLLVRDLDGAIELERLSDHLSALADGVLAVTVEECWRALPGRHRDDPSFAVIGYGKLGGKELGYASDLDLTFIYDDSDPRASECYARLARRVVLWLSSRTAAGVLFETDLRLRPDGEAGLIVTSLEAFRTYQRKSAWTWEHQALTRARYCAGSAAIGDAFEEERRAILTLPRERATLATEIMAMREKLFEGHPNRSGLFDLKHGRGGMIDIEFAVQFLVLCNAHRLPALTANLGNIALLRMAAEFGLIEPAVSDAARDAYRELRRLQHRLRLNDAAFARVPFASVERWALAGRALWDAVLAPRPPRADD